MVCTLLAERTAQSGQKHRYVDTPARGGLGDQVGFEKLVGLHRARCFESPDWRLFPHDHELGLAFEIDEGLAADIDGDAIDGAADEGVWRRSRVVVGDWFARVASHVEACASDCEGA